MAEFRARYLALGIVGDGILRCRRGGARIHVDYWILALAVYLRMGAVFTAFDGLVLRAFRPSARSAIQVARDWRPDCSGHSLSYPNCHKISDSLAAILLRPYHLVGLEHFYVELTFVLGIGL